MNQFWDRFVSQDRRKLRRRMLQKENPKDFFPLSQRTSYFQRMISTIKALKLSGVVSTIFSKRNP